MDTLRSTKRYHLQYVERVEESCDTPWLDAAFAGLLRNLRFLYQQLLNRPTKSQVNHLYHLHDFSYISHGSFDLNGL